MSSPSRSNAADPQVRARAPLTAASRAAILEQAERIIDNTLFRQSKRYPQVLRYLVEHALNGKGEPELKERTIGVEVLGRGPDYDTNADPSVRVVAGEIRKRLILYYQQPGHESQIRIDLPAGSYQPDFWMPGEWREPTPARAWWESRSFYGALSLLTACVAAVVWLTFRPLESALDSFWHPVFEASQPVLICIGVRPGGPLPPGVSPPQAGTADKMVEFLDRDPAIVFSDLLAANQVAEFLRSRNIPHRIRASTLTDLGQLREGPAILIGSFNNAWATRLNGDKRFRFEWHDPDRSCRIADRQNPTHRDWSMRTETTYSDVTADYGLVTRTFEPTTGRTVVTMGGLSGRATDAAAEFAVSPDGMKLLASNAPGGWRTKNLEIVIEVKLINGTAAPPRVVATHFW